MSTTTTTPRDPATAGQLAVPAAPVGVPAGSVGVPAGSVAAALSALADRRRVADRAEAELLVLAVQVAGLFPVTDATPEAGHGDGSLRLPEDALDAVVAVDVAPVGVGGPGTPPVAERAVVEVGATLALSYAAALALVAEAVELAWRLPRLWALVQSGRLQAWKARRVAAATQRLSAAAAAFVEPVKNSV